METNQTAEQPASEQALAAAWQIGWSDGYTAVQDAQDAGLPGSAEEPVDGWDGWTISAIGFEEFFKLLGDPQPAGEDGARSDWTPRRAALARRYAAGAQAGAEDCLRGIQR